MPLPTRKDRLLLAYLALTAGRPQARDRLAGLLWGDRGEAQARDSLKQALAGIRQAFRQVGLDPLRTDRETVTFDPQGIAVDAIAFEPLAAEAASSGQAIAAYQGGLLDGTDGVSAEYDAWLRPARERLHAMAARVLERFSEDASGDGEQAIRLGRRLLAHDRLCEPAYRALMRLYAGTGERVEALKLYSACRDALRQELGASPDLKTEQLYRDILTDRPAQSTTSEQVKPSAERPSIAVLPFSNLTRDPELDHLCEGLAEDIITGLGRFQLLFVIDRYSSSMIAKQETDVVEIGKRLGVAHLVQGSLQHQGGRARITVRLLDAATRVQLWGEAYDYPLADLASIPDTITGALVSRLHARVESALIEQGRRKPKMAAYDCVLRGIKHLRGYAPGDNERAVELFQQAIELDPDYALARAYRGFADVVTHGYDESPSEIIATAMEMATTAVQMDENDGRCHWLLGMVAGYAASLKEEERHYRRAIALNPNDANAICTLGGLLAALGRHEEGIELIRAAMRLNPYHPEWYWVDLGIVFYIARRYEDSVEAFRQRNNPGYWALARLAAAYAQLGRMDEATATVSQVLRLKPDFSVMRIRRAGWAGADDVHIRDGMLKAGLPA